MAGRVEFYENKYAEGEELPRTSKRYTLACLPDDRPLKVLDVGCGTGMNSAWIAERGHHVEGVDISANAIRSYRERGFTGHVMDCERGLEFPDNSFDAVFCSEVIEHLTDPEILVAAMFRVLRPGGLLVISTPNSAFWLYRLLGLLGRTVSELQHPKHVHFFSRHSLTRLLTDGGFDVERRLARNMYVLLPDLPLPGWAGLLRGLRFRKETRFRTGRAFWHLSHKWARFTALFGDTLIFTARTPRRGAAAGGGLKGRDDRCGF